MSFSSMADGSANLHNQSLDPFTSLLDSPAPAHRSWLVELVMAPFRDPDERAHYAAARRAAARAAAATGSDAAIGAA